MLISGDMPPQPPEWETERDWSEDEALFKPHRIDQHVDVGGTQDGRQWGA